MASLPIYAFGNNGDPVFLGQCTGMLSTCYYGGYAMESKCHNGKVCMLDINGKVPDTPDLPPPDGEGPGGSQKFKSFSKQSSGMEFESKENSNDDMEAQGLSIQWHRIERALALLQQTPIMPKCEVEPACMDCDRWEFVQ